jgi:hypothetical protein
VKHRSILAVVILTLVTFGLYGLYWEIVTAREMRKQGANIPNAILIIIPIANYYWLWRYSSGVEKITNGKWSAGLVFILFFLTGIGGIVLGQLAFNEDAGAMPTPGSASVAGNGDFKGPATVGGAVGFNQPDQPMDSSPDKVAQASSDPVAPIADIESSPPVPEEPAPTPELPTDNPEDIETSQPSSEQPAVEPQTPPEEPEVSNPEAPPSPPSDDTGSSPTAEDDNQNIAV